MTDVLALSVLVLGIYLWWLAAIRHGSISRWISSTSWSRRIVT